MREKSYLASRAFLLYLLLVCLNVICLGYLLLFPVGRTAYLVAFLLAFALLGITSFSYRWIYIPYRESNKTLQLFADGYILQGVFDLRVHFNEAYYRTFQKFREMINTKEMIEGAKKHAEYLALQNQINPHFLYNTLEGIRSEALMQDADSIAEMIEVLETFLRYTVSNPDKLATLREELANIDHYCTIQRFRFGERINFKIEDETGKGWEVLDSKLPKLTLQPIVENAFFHGIEPKLGKGLITVKVQATPSRLIIIISDNGMGIEEKHLRLLNDRLKGASLAYVEGSVQKSGIALLNVNSRIKLLFGDEYGLYIYSKVGVGTDVHITLPLIQQGEDHETRDFEN